MLVRYATITTAVLMAVTNSAPAQPTAINTPQADTVRAVRRIFQGRQRRAGIPLFIGVSYGVMGGAGYLFAPADGAKEWAVPAFWCMASVPFLAWGLIHTAAVKHREKQVIAAYTQAEPLPPRIQRQLAHSAKHFRLPPSQ